MPQYHEGKLDATDLKVAVVVARFNELITQRLLDGALDCLRRHGAAEDALHVVRVPGAFELPLAAKTAAQSGDFDAIVCLGAVVRGATPHFDLVAGEAARGATRAALDAQVPVTFGVLTTDTLEQAIERAGSKSGNKGWDAAMAAIEMAQLLRQMKRER